MISCLHIISMKIDLDTLIPSIISSFYKGKRNTTDSFFQSVNFQSNNLSYDISVDETNNQCNLISFKNIADFSSFSNTTSKNITLKLSNKRQPIEIVYKFVKLNYTFSYIFNNKMELISHVILDMNEFSESFSANGNYLLPMNEQILMDLLLCYKEYQMTKELFPEYYIPGAYVIEMDDINERMTLLQMVHL